MAARGEAALIDAAEHVVLTADPQTVTDCVAAVGALRDSRARALLWDFVERDIARGQALIAITWQKDPADLPRLAAQMDASLPYALHSAYGEAAMPYLQEAMRRAKDVHVRIACAREAVPALARADEASVLIYLGNLRN